ncbi:ATP-binding protein [Marinifilum sp. D737]|uniref:ATP-binding protein n=1 Tax=Marinifilum sp. D737 TaxID=2969628 RepID=UPI0022723756|nr:ATP-binding protein [Marinifilum sp. D737]MCY1636361.1 ATP-binding protein [Marinifilum sp. D737]
MSYKIAVCSGKGGTGKTTLAVNLFSTIQTKWTKRVQLIDCDVEEPNDLLFFKDAKIMNRSIVNQLVPVIDESQCTFCRKCEEYCEFNAISIIPSVKYASVDPNMCHSCGACLHACKFGAIQEYQHPIGELTSFSRGNQMDILEGSLKIGSPMQTKIIKELKANACDESDILIYDAPPGTSCPVVETVSAADFVILVTEPTPFGLYDLRLTVDLMKEMQKDFGIVVNKAGLGDREVYAYIKEEDIELLAEIPFNREYAGQYAQGKLLSDVPPLIEQEYLKLAIYLKNRMNHD